MQALRRATGAAADADSSLLLSSANVERLVDTLADLRGAAMKLGQLLSLQGSELLPPRLQEILSTLQDQAHFMPEDQLRRVLARQLGADWEEKFAEFDFEPLAAASIGQVHGAEATDGRDVVVKLQYPGVEKSIDSDVDNLAMTLRLLRLVPAAVDLDTLVPQLKRGLRDEADYAREARNTELYRERLGDDASIWVPRIHADLSTRRVLTLDRARGLPIDDLRSPEHTQERRDRIGGRLLRLVFQELFEFRLVQTDPNFANYLYEPKHERVALLDFGAVRKLSVDFSEDYRQLVIAAVDRDASRALEIGRAIGFLAGDETADAREAFLDFCEHVAEPLRGSGVYDFAGSDLPLRVRELGIEAYTKRGLHQPPAELIFLHRKLGGSYLLLAHIGARVDSTALYAELVR